VHCPAAFGKADFPDLKKSRKNKEDKQMFVL
jgi:hypothetical protein